MEQNIRKVNITEEAGKAVDRMIQDLNSEFSGGKINRTELLSWIAINFESNGYSEETKKSIRKQYFDQVAYLGTVLAKMKQAKKNGEDIPSLEEILPLFSKI
jgi:hypothetical protein